MTESEIQTKIANSNLILTYFSQPECNVCKTLRPKIEELITRYPRVKFQYIDTQLYSLLQGQYMIFAAPTILLFYQEKEVKRWSRYLSLDDIRDELDRYQGMISDHSPEKPGKSC